ncbi:MAG TPA: hypothetical protein VK806_05525 [Bacteroidia bacterium]|jgi:hypothetical protein|nr:hypothetical protein [Bacteroidia bacterium]
MKKLLFLAFIILWLSSFGQLPILKEEVEICNMPNHGPFKLFPTKQIETFTIYNKTGKEIEFGRYGEYRCKRVGHLNKDSSYNVHIYTKVFYSKLNYIEFSFYDSIGNLSRKETWFYKNNKKNDLGDALIYKYGSNNKLLRTIGYTDSDKIARTSTFIYDKFNNETEEIDSEYELIYDLHKTVRITKKLNSYDSLKRIICSIDSTDGKFTNKTKYIRPIDTNIVIELRYDTPDDTSLYLCLETRSTYKNNKLYSRKIRRSRGLLNPNKSDTTDEYDEYIRVYNADGTLDRINCYHKEPSSAEPYLSDDYYIYKYYK